MLKKWIFLFFVAFCVSVSGVCYGQKIRMRHFDTSAIRNVCHRLVMRYADNGYPFARVVADSAVVAGRRRVDVYCSTFLSQRYRIANVYTLGGEGLSPYYIHSVTGIAPGATYNESRVLHAARRIAVCGAAEALQDAETEFHPGGEADVYLYLKRRRSNAVSAGLSLNRSAVDGQYFVTGNALSDLCNNFGHGERFYFSWNGYDRRSQMLDLQVRWPYVFDTPIMPDFCVNITRTDTICLTVQLKAALGVAVSPDVEVKAVADVRRLISTVDVNDVNNVRTSLYGVAVNCSKSFKNDTRFDADWSAMGGMRRGGDNNGSVAEISAVVESQIPICWWARYEGGWTALQMYFAHKPDIHECSPIGGAGSLRGFVPNELRATGLVSMCNTFRVLVTEEFSVQMDYDQVFYKCKSVQGVWCDTPSGFGAGIGFKKGAISLDIGWAIGCEYGKMRPLKDAKTLIITRLDF